MSIRDDLLRAIDFNYATGPLGYGTPEELLAAYDASRALADRAAVLHIGADAIDATFTGPGLDRYTRYGADLLRRMADKEQS